MASFNKHCIKGLHFLSYLSKLTLRQWQGQCKKSLLSRTSINQSIRTTCNQSVNFQKMTKEYNCSKMKQDRIHVPLQSNRTRKSFFKYRRCCELYFYVRVYSTKIAQFTLKNETYKEYLNSLELECQDLNNAQMAGERMGNEKACRLLVLRKIVDLYEELKAKYGDLVELNDMQHVEEMQELVKEERQTCITEIEELEEKLVKIICPVEEVDDCDIILEIESGAGGQEAMLFVEEVFELYQKYAQLKGWQFEITQFSNAEEGVRKVSAAISGQGVYGELKYEGGIHRVQRVPKTESKGRIHTSTISVAILPQPKEIDSKINPNDVEITTMRSSGPGGQHVNKTNTAVRVKHLPTGIAVKCQVTRSQVQNMEMAFLMLKTKIFEQEYQKQMAQTVSQRKIQVGNKDRSEKIRTYNFAQDRITDHRLGYNFHNIADFMSGGHSLQKMITQLQEEANLENLNILLQEFEEKHLKKKDRS